MWKTTFILSLLLVCLLLSACQPVVATWYATYCSDPGCPQGSKVVNRSGDLHEGDALGCPYTESVFQYFIPTGKVLIPIYHTYYLKQDTCQVYQQ